MKFDDNMVSILENFQEINPTLLIECGNVLKTMSPAKSIVAKTVLPVTFDKRVAIYDLRKFIASIKLFKEPDLTFKDNYVIISKNNVSIRFLYADEELIIKPVDKQLTLPSIDVEFDITKEQLNGLFKAIKVLQLQQVYISGDGINVYVQAGNDAHSSMTYSIEIGKTNNTFKFVFNEANLKIIHTNYHVQISKSKISYFKGDNIEYYIAVSNESSFS